MSPTNFAQRGPVKNARHSFSSSTMVTSFSSSTLTYRPLPMLVVYTDVMSSPLSVRARHLNSRSFPGADAPASDSPSITQIVTFNEARRRQKIPATSVD